MTRDPYWLIGNSTVTSTKLSICQLRCHPFSALGSEICAQPLISTFGVVYNIACDFLS